MLATEKRVGQRSLHRALRARTLPTPFWDERVPQKVQNPVPARNFGDFGGQRRAPEFSPPALSPELRGPRGLRASWPPAPPGPPRAPWGRAPSLARATGQAKQRERRRTSPGSSPRSSLPRLTIKIFFMASVAFIARCARKPCQLRSGMNASRKMLFPAYIAILSSHKGHRPPRRKERHANCLSLSTGN